MASSTAGAVRTARLLSGRTIAYREYGDLDGLPVLFFHGNLNSRLFEPCWDKTDQATKDAGVRVIAVDRRGYGGSDFDPKGSYLSWASDMDDFSEQVNLGKFAVAGYSSGGPHALACGAAERLVGASLHSKVLGVCLISSDGPYAQLGADTIRKVYGLDPPISREQALQLAERNAASMKAGYEGIPKEEKRTIALADLAAATAQGLAGSSHDVLLETGDWGFDLEAIDKPVHLWHGDKDADVPPAVCDFLYDALGGPNRAQVVRTMIPGENHTLLRRHWSAILRGLREAVARSGSTSAGL